MNEADYIDPWWKRIGCMRNPGVHTGEEAAMVSEIKELREALQPDPDAIDYRELLKKYMKHVIDSEGWDFLQNLNGHESSVRFTEYEVTMLQTFSDEVSDE